ncbi:MAG TPA: helix-turn-helix transcriptional regulator [Gemmataceae bacterium]|nr:helix-turn-helix transcriptional regulator [Gemmataceae bacterium]
MSAKWFAGRLRELRLAAGLSQKDLAERAGIDKDSLSRLERDKWQPTWETVLALASALDVEVGAFTVAPKDEPAPQRGRPRNPSSPEESSAEDKPAVPEPKKPAAKKARRKK